MTWEVKEGHCAECGEFGTWLEFYDARQLPDGWFAVTDAEDATLKRVILCSVRCVQARSIRAQGQGADPSSPAKLP